MRFSRRSLLLLLLGHVAGACGGQPPAQQVAAAITDGNLDNGHPAVGLLQAGTSGKVLLCTGTLIGPRTVITAAHCIRTGEVHTITLQGTAYQAASALQHPAWNPEDSSHPNDLAIIKLSQAPAITPVPIAKRAPWVGEKITLVGFGATAQGLEDLGTKRWAINYVEVVQEKRFSLYGTGNGTGSTCKGDSGGPALLAVDGKEPLIGVSSAGLPDCGTLAWETRVDAYWDWIVGTAGGAAEVQIVVVSEPVKALVGGCQLGGPVRGLPPWLALVLWCCRRVTGRRRGAKGGRRQGSVSYFSP
jgi:hypothetical protein